MFVCEPCRDFGWGGRSAYMSRGMLIIAVVQRISFTGFEHWSRASFDFRECTARIDPSMCAVRAFEGTLRIPSTFVSQDSNVPQRQQFGPKAERANVAVGTQLCVGVPDIDEIPLGVRHRKR